MPSPQQEMLADALSLIETAQSSVPSEIPCKISVEGLHEMVLERMRLKYGANYHIEIYITDIVAESFHSILVSTEDKAIIALPKGVNYCSRRLSIAKELIHLYLNEEFSWHSYSKAQLSDVLSSLRFTSIYDPEVKNYLIMGPEKIGLQCALRFLFPRKFKNKVVAELKSGQEINEVVEKYAEILKIPQIALEQDLIGFNEQ